MIATTQQYTRTIEPSIDNHNIFITIPSLVAKPQLSALLSACSLSQYINSYIISHNLEETRLIVKTNKRMRYTLKSLASNLNITEYNPQFRSISDYTSLLLLLIHEDKTYYIYNKENIL